jgi:hypothetical protein
MSDRRSRTISATGLRTSTNAPGFPAIIARAWATSRSISSSCGQRGFGRSSRDCLGPSLGSRYTATVVVSYVANEGKFDALGRSRCRVTGPVSFNAHLDAPRPGPHASLLQAAP